MAKKNDARNERIARDRLREFEARKAQHENRKSRRRRDNWIAIVATVVALLLAGASQTLYYFTSGQSEAASTEASAAPDPSLSENRTWTGSMSVAGVPVGFELDGTAAPQAVASTVSLAQSSFYENTTCHRITTAGSFVLQCGDPNGDGTGGPGYSYGPIENAPVDNFYPAGTIAMARSGNDGNSMGSQFFIVYQDSPIPPDQAGGYTVIGHVTSGLEQLNAEVTSKGTPNGTDGPPAIPVTITAFTLQ